MLNEKTECNRIINNLKQITDLLDSEQDKNLLIDISSLDNYVSNPNFIVSVFGSFNRGKSTLLNALLGNKLLPAALIPTTGAAINIKYGIELETRIILSNGTKIIEKGTEALQNTRLNSQRQMPSDIISVEMFIPHPLLKNGIELIDLPGTNDGEAQNELVRNQLLSTDLIINVLDASQLFTLTEAENLQNWLIEREITTVIFVVNFLNLLEVKDQIMVIQRARFLAEEFRGNFPDGINNLYRVDALPALKAKLKGDMKTAFSTGILNFESALQNIANLLSNELYKYRLPRVITISNQVKQSLSAKI
ncbi:MAG: dynamin family protein [Cyanobacteria bacterium J06633_8]